jgi:hypothetical protein
MKQVIVQLLVEDHDLDNATHKAKEVLSPFNKGRRDMIIIINNKNV